MAKDLYTKIGQRIYFQREQAYGEIYDPEAELTAFTSVPDDYPHWRRLDFIPEGVDMMIPFIEKIKGYDLADAKHPSAIFSGNITPQEFTIEMNAMGLEFLLFAIGTPAFSSGTRALIQTIKTLAKASITDNDYFLLDIIVSDNIEHHLFWFDVTTSGSAPTVTGINASNMHEVAIDGATTATDVAVILAGVIDGVSGAGGASSVDVVTVTNTSNGACQPAHDGEAKTDFIFGVTTFGATNYTVTENTGYTLPSFTMRVEQINSGDATEDLIYDLFGCVIEEIGVTINFEDKIVKASVVVKCPYALENTTHGRADIHPPAKNIDAFPTMLALKEATDNCLIQAGATATVNSTDDLTPKQLEKVLLRIKNNVEFKPDIEKQYMDCAIAGKRDVEMEVTGLTDEKELFNYWQEKFKLSGSDWIPDDMTEKLNTTFRLERDTTYDYILISIYNWMVEEHNFHFVNVDEAVKYIDMKLTDGTADTNGRIIDSMTVVSPIDQCVMTYNV